MRVRHADEYSINRNGETISFRSFFFLPLSRVFRSSCPLSIPAFFAPSRRHSRMRSFPRRDGKRSKSAPTESVRSTASCDRYHVARSSHCARRAAFFLMYIHVRDGDVQRGHGARSFPRIEISRGDNLVSSAASNDSRSYIDVFWNTRDNLSAAR